jgi:protein N-lysine methyltransferase METTL21D
MCCTRLLRRLTTFISLAMSSLGWDVLATDIFHVISSVLHKNIKNNLSALPIHSGTIHIRELDWTVQPEQWRWDHELYIASHSSSISVPAASNSHCCPPFDLIYSADTVYSAGLLDPMLRTLHALSTLSAAASPSHRFPPILLCMERRDSLLIDRLLGNAKNIWHFNVERISHKKLAKVVERSGVHWSRTDWEDVEIWKLKLDPR